MFSEGYISGEKCIQLKITILRNLAYALGRKEKYHAAIKMTECVKKLSLKYDYGYKLCIAINDMSWIYKIYMKMNYKKNIIILENSSIARRIILRWHARITSWQKN